MNSSITKRWVRGSLLFTLLVVLVAEALFLYFMISGYYNDSSAAIRDNLNTIQSQLSLFKSASSEEKALRLYRTVEQFEHKDQFELLLIDANGAVVLSSSGVPPAAGSEMPADVIEVVRDGTADQAQYIGKNENGEKVMAITQRTPYVSGNIIAIRIVTSLTLVDNAIGNLVFLSAGLILVIVLFSVVSGVYFIRSIVFPLQKVEATAARIAEGDFATRIETNSNDEVGRLCRTINHMAEELSRSEAMKNDFISSVSHELRTPLTSIKGWTETVGNFRDPEDPNFKRGVAIIASEADRLYGMVEELLDFSRLQNDMKLQAELLDFAAEVEEAVLLATQRAAKAGIQLHYEAPELPVPVLADKNRVRQVLVNIIDNAVKYAPENSSVEIDLTLNERDACLCVTDHGPGIDPEDLKNVKMKFFKGKNAVRGSGIGLAVVDTIMRAHKGEFEITSTLGSGTQVWLWFPLYIREADTTTSTLQAVGNAPSSADDLPPIESPPAGEAPVENDLPAVVGEA